MRRARQGGRLRTQAILDRDLAPVDFRLRSKPQIRRTTLRASPRPTLVAQRNWPLNFAKPVLATPRSLRSKVPD